MEEEIERKFLVRKELWPKVRKGAGLAVRQGYLCTDPARTVRVRMVDRSAYLTIKGPSRGYARSEFEYPIPADEAEYLLEKLCVRPLIEKTRYRIRFKGRLFEVDEFGAENKGLLLAELELQDESEKPDLPEWIGEEVSADPRYFNSSLTERPFSTWPKS